MNRSSKARLALEGGRPVRSNPWPNWPVSGPREEELLRQVLFSAQWGGYNELVTQFEQLFAGLHDSRFGISVANGTLALELMLIAAGIGPGDEVVVPAHSFIATATAVSRVGATPVFVDIERETFNINLADMERALSDATKAVIAVHFAGLLCDMDQMSNAVSRHGIKLFEDAAHAHGAEYHGQRAGGFGFAATFSFQNSKAMTAGEGGILVTSDEDLAAQSRSLANCGRRSDGDWFEHFELGSNFRLSGFQAAVLLAQLDRLADQIRLRGQNAALLREELADVPGIHLQSQSEAANVHTLYLLPGWVEEKVFGVGRDGLLEALEAEGIPFRPFYPHPLYANPLYEKHSKRVTDCPVAEQACKDSFWIPQRLLMGAEQDIHDIVTAILKVHEAYKPQKPKKAPNGGLA